MSKKLTLIILIVVILTVVGYMLLKKQAAKTVNVSHKDAIIKVGFPAAIAALMLPQEIESVYNFLSKYNKVGEIPESPLLNQIKAISVKYNVFT